MKTLSLILIMMAIPALTEAGPLPVFFGTSSNPKSDSKGIYTASFDPANGKLGTASLAARIDSPGFLTLHPDLPILYSTGRLPESREHVVAAWHMETSDETARLQAVNAVPTGAESATHLAVHPTGRFLVTVQYGHGSVAVFSLREDGRLKERTQLIQHEGGTQAHPTRQEGPHPHSVTFAPGGDYALVADLGADETVIYKVDVEAGRLQRHSVAPSDPAAGPRHLKFSADGRFVFVLNELSLTVDSFEWNPREGRLTRLHQTASLPAPLKEKERSNTASEIQVHPNGFFVYAANRGNDSIAVFRKDPYTGELRLQEIEPVRAAWPRHFDIDPTGRWILCGGQHSSNVGVFAIDPETGNLTYQPDSSIQVPSPICVLFGR